MSENDEPTNIDALRPPGAPPEASAPPSMRPADAGPSEVYDPESYDVPDDISAADDDEDGESEEKFRVVRADVLGAEEDDLLGAWGFSYLKRQRGHAVEFVEVKIRGLALDYYESLLEDEKPMPPKARRSFKRGSQAAADFDLPDGGAVMVHDFTHPDYVKARDAWSSKKAWALLAEGIAQPLYIRSKKRVAENLDERIQALKEMNLTDAHFQRLTTDILMLTRTKKEEETAFSAQLSGSGGTGS